MLYDNVSDTFEFERSRAKVKVTVAIFKTTFSFTFVFRQILCSLTIYWRSLSMSVLGPSSRAQGLV